MKTFAEYLKEQPENEIDTNTVIDIYFNNLDETIQKKVMTAITTEKNVSDDDDYANKKIVEGLSKTPLFSITGKDIVTKVKFDI